MQCSLIIPTHNRAGALRETIGRIASLQLGEKQGEIELVVVDNASNTPVELPQILVNGIRMQSIRLETNLNTAARNIAAEQANGRWLFMLDDDSSPLDLDFVKWLDEVPEEIAAIGAEIYLPSGSHESGGLPEVIIGCGCAIRRDVFLGVGGYDASFGYYAEEYDLCAKLIAAGQSVVHTRDIQVLHRKEQAGRNFGEILFRLVRNNGWVVQRYAPDAFLRATIDEMLDRYRQIAIKEGVIDSFERAIRSLETSFASQARTPLSVADWDRFTGRAAARSMLGSRLGGHSGSVSIVGDRRAKGYEIIEQEVLRLGYWLADDPSSADASVIGVLSPGPMLDLAQEYPDAICPWEVGSGGRIKRDVRAYDQTSTD